MKKVVASAWLWRILYVVRNTLLLKTVQTWRRRDVSLVLGVQINRSICKTKTNKQK